MCRLRAECSDHPRSSVLCVLTAASSVCSARPAEQYQHDEFMTLHLCKHYSLKNLICTTPILKTCAECLPVKTIDQLEDHTTAEHRRTGIFPWRKEEPAVTIWSTSRKSLNEEMMTRKSEDDQEKSTYNTSLTLSRTENIPGDFKGKTDFQHPHRFKPKLVARTRHLTNMFSKHGWQRKCVPDRR